MLMITKILSLFGGLVNLFNRSKDRQAGRDEAKVANLEGQADARLQADKVYNSANRGRFKRLRDDGDD